MLNSLLHQFSSSLVDDPARIEQANDPALFARKALGFTPDSWQAEFLRSDSKRILLNCSRQAGKSSTSAALALHTAEFKPGSLIIMISPSLRQSVELFRKFQEFARSADVQFKEDTKTQATFMNGSRIASLPGTPVTTRGFSAVDLILEDEASQVSDALYTAIRPMLAVSDGRLILMSTPFGKRGHFYNAWESGGERWERFMVTAEDCPRISAEFLEEERLELGPLGFRSEYMCEFVDTTDTVFRSEDIDAAMSDEVEPLFPDWDWSAAS